MSTLLSGEKKSLKLRFGLVSEAVANPQGIFAERQEFRHNRIIRRFYLQAQYVRRDRATNKAISAGPAFSKLCH
jgi:hypothetical protein